MKSLIGKNYSNYETLINDVTRNGYKVDFLTDTEITVSKGRKKETYTLKSANGGKYCKEFRVVR